MSAEEYRQRAHECFLAAENVFDPGTKIWLLEMAQSWLVLAQQAEKNLAADPVREPVQDPVQDPVQYPVQYPAHAAPRSHAEPVMQQQQQVQPKKEPKKDPKKDPGAKNE